ncbi:MAG: large subunit ribosomal protein [Acidimicrobiaceae bacterium]|jgi:large subunit ribosomal protein L25|nr:large subunit ribosomal protein [Acidimicrobiaceae bacterium]
MPEITLPAVVGRPTGSRAANRLRASGQIPGVLYGHGTDPLPIAVEARALRSALSGDAGLNALLSLELDGRAQLAMAKDIQRDPVRGTVSHVDFLLVNRDEIITADIPIQVVGDAQAVLRADGVVDQSLFTLTVHAKPGDLPHAIEVDVSDMVIGDAIRVDDLDLPAGVHTDQDPETAIVVAQAPQAEVAAEPEAGAEGAADTGAGGAEGTGGDAGQSGQSGGGSDSSGSGSSGDSA